MELSIILVNWNCLAFTEQCIASIRETIQGIDYEILVVDNHSSDAPCSSLAERFPEVRLHLLPANIGFGRANNVGAAQASGRLLFFLNPDTLLEPDSVRRMVEVFAREPQTAVVGCRLLNPDRSLQLSSVQSFPTILNQVFAVARLQRAFPRLRLWGKQALYQQDGSTQTVQIVSGAALMMRRAIFEEVGGFRHDSFMYAEEVEICHAARQAGYRVRHSSAAEIIHFGGQSTKTCEDGFVDLNMRDAVYRFLRRTRGEAYGWLYRGAMLSSAVGRLMMLALAAPVVLAADRPWTRQMAARAARKWLRIGRWSLGGRKSDGEKGLLPQPVTCQESAYLGASAQSLTEN